MAAISVASKTRGSFTVQLTGLDSAYSGKTRSAKWYCGSISQGTQTLSNGITTSPQFVLSKSLVRYTSYTIKCVVTYYDGSTAKTVTLTTTARTASTPAYFSWNDGEKVKGEPFDLTASEWNALCSNINLVRVSQGYSNYSFTKAYKGNNFKATMYNQAVNAITGMGYGDYLYTVSKGEAIWASELNNLVDAINEVP